MQYMLMIHIDEAMGANVPPEQMAKGMEAYAAYNRALEKAGILISGERLTHSSTSTCVRVQGEKTDVLDGPFADTKEQIGGFYLIDTPDLETALKWAARCPGASHGTVEVRAIAGMRL